jgi:putative oxidoreductase
MKKDIGNFILRLVTGLIFLYAGGIKLLNLGTTTEFLNNIGLPFPNFMAIILAIVELFGGLLLILGLLMNYATILLAFTMLVAIITVHLKEGMSMQNIGLMYTFMLLIINLSLFFSGPGDYSLKALFKG